jgi:coproporphyrinogen III oxidase
MVKYIKVLQGRICRRLESLDGHKFSRKIWKRESGGGGTSKYLQNGNIFEKAGVNISVVHGLLDHKLASLVHSDSDRFRACGLSMILHPVSPRIPTIHLNVRYFELEDGESWYGGVIDLTPYYPHPEDFIFFHQVIFEACERVKKNSYSEFKLNCDRYFYLPHRGEMRGVGGIFFDKLHADNQIHFELIKGIGQSFFDSYIPIVRKREGESFSQQDKKFQLIRRARYVEFNLIYDQGTKFGLGSGGSSESVLISLPPEAHFISYWQPDSGSPYARMLEYYKPQDWIYFTVKENY